MGWFIGGVLVGWLAEWLFFTFFMKKDANGASSNGSNATALQAELNSKSKEISILKAKLADASGTASSSATTSSGGTASKAEAAKSTKMPSTAKPKPTTASKSVTASTKTATTKTKTSAIKTSKAKATTATKTAAKKATAKKPVVKKAVATQSTTAKKPASKTTAKGATAKKPTPKAAVKIKSVTPKATTKGDDFTRLSGIGPSMATTLNDLGIDTYQKLAAMDDDILRDMLESSGARLNNNKDAMDSWNEQATLADKGDFAGLKKLQDELKT